MSDKLREAVQSADDRLDLVEQSARDLIAFADGLEEGGLRVYAQRSRAVARNLLQCAADLRAERSARAAIQAERDRIRAMLTASET
jgi:hypothetical protein